jgi:hypothetical protein
MSAVGATCESWPNMVEIPFIVTDEQIAAEADMLRDYYRGRLTLAMPLIERDHDPRTVEALRG